MGAILELENLYMIDNKYFKYMLEIDKFFEVFVYA